MGREAAVEEVSAHREEFWLFGGVGSGVPSRGSPSVVAMVIIITGVGCTRGRKREPGN